MVRLGKKYEISSLRDEALAHLKREFSTTLEEYDRLPEYYTNFTLPTYPISKCGSLDALLDIVNLAHEFGIQSILPAVYMLITSYSLENLLYNSTAPITHDAPRSITYGRDKLIQARRKQFDNFGEDKGCNGKIDRPKCLLLSQFILAQWWKVLGDLAGSRTISQTWTDVEARMEKTLGEENPMRLCSSCMRHAQKVYTEGRTKIWGELPSYFKLPGWDDLEDFQI